jgi:hypothetical protein
MDTKFQSCLFLPPFKANNNKSAINERAFVVQAITKLLLHVALLKSIRLPGLETLYQFPYRDREKSAL